MSSNCEKLFVSSGSNACPGMVWNWNKLLHNLLRNPLNCHVGYVRPLYRNVNTHIYIEILVLLQKYIFHVGIFLRNMSTRTAKLCPLMEKLHKYADSQLANKYPLEFIIANRSCLSLLNNYIWHKSEICF